MADNAKKSKIIAIIPAYNEEKHIFDVASKTKKYVDTVIVVDDGSADKTYEEAKRAKADFVLKHIINMKKGAALRTGFEAALRLNPDLIITLDADGQHSPDDISRLVNALKENNMDIIIGSRKRSENMPFVFKLGNFGLNQIFRFLFKLKIDDTQSGFRAIKADVCGKIKWNSSGYAVETEMLANAGKHKLRCKEVPIETIYLNNVKGTTVIDGIRIFLQMLLWKIKN